MLAIATAITTYIGISSLLLEDALERLLGRVVLDVVELARHGQKVVELELLVAAALAGHDPAIALHPRVLASAARAAQQLPRAHRAPAIRSR